MRELHAGRAQMLRAHDLARGERQADPHPRWPESYTLGHTHAQWPGGLTAREQEQLVEAALQTLFGVDSESLTDAALVQWRFAFEAVIPEGTYSDLPWAERYFPYLTAVCQDAGEPTFHKASGLARGYAENRQSLLSWKKDQPLVLAEGAPPAIVVPLLEQLRTLRRAAECLLGRMYSLLEGSQSFTGLGNRGRSTQGASSRVSTTRSS